MLPSYVFQKVNLKFSTPTTTYIPESRCMHEVLLSSCKDGPNGMSNRQSEQIYYRGTLLGTIV